MAIWFVWLEEEPGFIDGFVSPTPNKFTLLTHTSTSLSVVFSKERLLVRALKASELDPSTEKPKPSLWAH